MRELAEMLRDVESARLTATEVALRDEHRGAQIADLRKAYRAAMAEISACHEAMKKMAAALQRHDDNWRAMKGLPPRQPHPHHHWRQHADSRRRMTFLEKVKGWWFR